MNKMIKHICILFITGMSLAMAFDNPFVLPGQFQNDIENPLAVSVLTGSPASMVYTGNVELFTLTTRFADNRFQRVYDPASTQLYQAAFTTLRQINDRSFFLATISYDQYDQKDLFASLERDFYDDYFSMIDSTLGNTKYYGPRLGIMYNVQLSDHIFFGIEGNYGVERSLKDTFPQTITIMRNSGYSAGLDYRAKSLSIGVHGRYYDDQTYYEAVKQYTDVETKTYIGYNIFYNEISSSTAEKRRARNGLEYGGHLQLGGQKAVSLNLSLSGLHRISRADFLRSSTTRPRGIWQRQGIHLLGSINIYPDSPVGIRVYGEYLHFNDWAESMISNALVIENEERISRVGGMIVNKPSSIQQIFVGAEIGMVAYDYVEYVFPFSDTRSGKEWKLYAGGSMYLTSKTHVDFSLSYDQEIPKFYWGTESFENINVIINLEQLFDFGYIGLNFENISKKPSNATETINVLVFGLSYRRK